MGYAATTVVILGVELEASECEALWDSMRSELKGKGLSDERIESMSLHEAMDELGYATGSSDLRWAAEGADSRIHNCGMYDKKDDLGGYVIGLKVASKGYGANDDIPKAILMCSRPDWIMDYEDSVGMLLADRLGMSRAPSAQVITQVW